MHELVHRAEEIVGEKSVAHRRAVALHCRGLYELDLDRLVEAASNYAAAGRPLPHAQASEAAGMVSADAGDRAAAQNHIADAYTAYLSLRAERDLARLRARFHAYGLPSSPRLVPPSQE